MLTLINTLSLATALTLQPQTATINITFSQSELFTDLTIKSTLVKSEDTTSAFTVFFLNNEEKYAGNVIISNYTDTASTEPKTSATVAKIAIGYNDLQDQDIKKYKEFNNTTRNSNYYYFTDTIKNYDMNGSYSIDINIRSKNYMEELLTALTTAVQSAVSIFVEGFGGLTQIFYNGTEITFIGGILIVGLAVMFLMMFLRWIVSFVKGI